MRFDMTWLANTLWDLLLTNGRNRSRVVAKPRQRPKLPARVKVHKPAEPAPARATMQAKYDAVVVEMKARYHLHVRKWRKSSSGVAWEVRYRDGTVRKFIESRYPRGPMSAAIFLHEVGHHAIGLGKHRPRCLEEYRVWVWAIHTMREKGLNVTPAVERRVELSIRYAVGKARRRGMRDVPEELARFT